MGSKDEERRFREAMRQNSNPEFKKHIEKLEKAREETIKKMDEKRDSNAEYQRNKLRTTEERHRDAKDRLTKAVTTYETARYGEANPRRVEELVNRISHKTARDRGEE